MTGHILIITFALSLLIMVLAISKLKVPPFCALLVTAIVISFIIGIPAKQVPNLVFVGFWGILKGIALVILLGTIIGYILDKTGAAIKIAEEILKLIGPKHPHLALIIIGWFISIPIFCDSGFVIINPIRKALARKCKVSPVGLSIALAAGLYTSHVLIPPTPGPIAAASFIGIGDTLFQIIGIGAIVSIPTLTVAYFFSKYIGNKVVSLDDNSEQSITDYEEYINRFDKLPSITASICPIIIPIILMALGSLNLLLPTGIKALDFWSKPVRALAVGVIVAMPLLIKTKSLGQIWSILINSIKTSLPIIGIIAAGNVLGQVILASGFVSYIQSSASTLSTIGIFFPFIIAVILRTILGSATVSIITTASIIGMFSESSSLCYALGMTTTIQAALVVLAIGAGSMIASHANDSYFWVVTKFGGIAPKDGFKTHTLMTIVLGCASIITIFILSLFLH